jgi:uncharacterized membrane protein
MPLSESALSVLALAAVLGCGAMAGLFFAFSNFVMRALSRLPPGHAVAAMNSINVEIVNPLFLLLFLGTAAVCLLLVIHAALYAKLAGAGFALWGGGAYLVGALAVTVVCNVPRNNALARVDPASPAAADAWRMFVSAWVAWNHVRTIACLVATLLLACALAELSAAVR